MAHIVLPFLFVSEMTGKEIEISRAEAIKLLHLNIGNLAQAIVAIEKMELSGRSRALYGNQSWRDEERDDAMDRRMWWMERPQSNGKVIVGWIRKNLYED